MRCVPAVDLAIVRRYPSLAAHLPRFGLTALPTPVERADGLTAACGVADLWIKRDDRSGALYGGNKPRKLELIVGDALARHRTRLLTFGGIGTHHGLATAVAARAAGLATTLVLVPQPVTDAVRRNLLLLHACGAELHLAHGVAGTVARALGLLARDRLRGERTGVVPPGGSSVLGTIAYASAAMELAEQVERGELPEPAAVVVALGSGGTVAGILLGLALAGLATRVVGVLVTDILPPSSRRLVWQAQRALRHLRARAPEVPAVTIDAARLTVERAWLGDGYGAATPDAVRACALAREHAGIALETTYTGKAMAACLALGARGGPLTRGPIVFWHTYSATTPAVTLPAATALPPALRPFLATSG